MSGIQKWYSVRMIKEGAIMSKRKVQVRKWSCACTGCLTGDACEIHDNYNDWLTVEMTLKPVSQLI